LLGPVFLVIENFGHPRKLPVLPLVFSVFLYLVFGLFGSVFGHDHIDQTKNGSTGSSNLTPEFKKHKLNFRRRGLGNLEQVRRQGFRKLWWGCP
jgi:hypothetical protein